MSRNRVIGRDNGLPWHLPADLQHFKRTTLGKPILMGRKTYDSIGRPLPGRLNLVLTRDRAWQAAGITVVHSLDEAFAQCAGAAEIAGIGGAQIFEQLLPLSQRIHLTRIDRDFEGDTFFPELSPQTWQETQVQRYPADARNDCDMDFITLQRVPAAAV